MMQTIQQLLNQFTKTPKVFTDTRKVIPGGMFFALKGPRFDGNQFAAQAIEKGAGFAVVDDPKVVVDPKRYFLVEDVLTALQDLARAYRKTLNIPVIGITGSNGKTTTKELVSAVLGQKYDLFYTQGNLNNHIGVPLTILSISSDKEMAVIEMGANHVGEIALLSSIAQPTHGLITNIGKAHLEGFGGVEGIKKGKSEIYDFLSTNNGVAFINRDEAFLADLSSRVSKRIFYGSQAKEPLDYRSELKSIFPFLKVQFKNESDQIINIDSNLIGAYNFNNINTAIALGRYFEVDSIDIKKAIEKYIPTNNRSQVLEQDSNRIFLDAYNANPTSMGKALENFAQVEHLFKIVVLGDMLELGAYAREEHQKLITQVEAMKVQQAVFVGPLFKAAVTQKNFPTFDTVDELIPWWKAKDFKNALILIKGSRGIKLERLLEN